MRQGPAVLALLGGSMLRAAPRLRNAESPTLSVCKSATQPWTKGRFPIRTLSSVMAAVEYPSPLTEGSSRRDCEKSWRDPPAESTKRILTRIFGSGPDRDRTDYPRHAMAVLYQVSYGPNCVFDASRGAVASFLCA